MNEASRSELERMLEGLGAREASGSHDPGATGAFISRVRRRRRARVAKQACSGLLAVVLVGAVAVLGWRTPGDPSVSAPTYAALEGPALPIGNTGGPVPPIRAGIRLDDPLALTLLQ